MNWVNFVVIFAMVMHLLFHVVGSVGVAIGLIHSHRVHKARWWKLLGAVLWVVISIFVIWHGRHEFFALTHGEVTECTR